MVPFLVQFWGLRGAHDDIDPHTLRWKLQYSWWPPVRYPKQAGAHMLFCVLEYSSSLGILPVAVFAIKPYRRKVAYKEYIYTSLAFKKRQQK